MYKICKTEQSAARQRELEQGLLRAMTNRRYEDIAIIDLCQAMGITRKTFYRYFSGKDGCLYALLDHTMMDFFSASQEPSKKTTGSAIGDLSAFFSFWYSQQRLLNALQKSALMGTLSERALQLVNRERLLPRHILSWKMNHQQIAAAFAISGLYSMISMWHAQNFATPPEQMAQLATTLLTHPLIPV